MRGSRKLDMEDPEKFKEYTKEVRKLFEDHPVLGESMKRFGTGGDRQHHQRPQHPADAQLPEGPLRPRP